VPSNADVSPFGEIASAESEEIDDDDAMPAGDVRHHVLPEVGRRRKAMEEDDRIPVAPRPGGVVVDASAGEIEEFSSHRTANEE
jgi:hypothetical protein